MSGPVELGIVGLTNLERIGSGGNAVVYRARQDDLDRDVVVKVLLAVDAEATRRRFDRERRAMGRLSQAAGIAPLYDTGITSGGQPYLLMPFYERGSLQEALERDGALAPEHVRNLGITICRAVHTAHEHGVLHRDLKPANILIRRSGQPDVADFGIAHLVDDTGGASRALTMTPLYTAPEVFDGVDSGVLSDVYSLGATLYALVNGRPAYSDADNRASMLSLMRRIHEEPLPPLPPGVPDALAAIIAKAMSKNPTQRYQSAAALADELAAVDLAVPADARTGRRVLVGVGMLAIVAFAVGAVVLASLVLNDSEETADLPANTPVASPSPDPSPASSPSEVVTSPVDPARAVAGAEAASVLVEGFSCTGANVAPGILLGDGRVITDRRILASPWHVAVSGHGELTAARPLTWDLNYSLALVGLEQLDGFESPSVALSAPGDSALIVGDDGEAVDAVLEAMAGDETRLLATSDDFGSVDHVDAVMTVAGALIGVAAPGDTSIEVVTPRVIDDHWNRVPPVFGCPNLRRDLSADAAGSAEAPSIGELLTMQALSNAYADENWSRVRELEPAKSTYTDQNFVDGWRPLRQGFVYPVERQVEPDGSSRWRIGLIGHETWSGNDLTTLFCLTWTVDPRSGTVTQTNEDNAVIYGPRPGQPQRQGFVDPGDLRLLIDANC